MFKPIDDLILMGNGALTKEQSRAIEDSASESYKIAKLCGPNDMDVVEWHTNYVRLCLERIARCIDALENRLNSLAS